MPVASSLGYLQRHLVEDRRPIIRSSPEADWWSPIFALAHANGNAQMLASGDEEGVVSLVNLGTALEEARVPLDDAVFDLHWSPDDAQLVLNLMTFNNS